MPTDDNERTLPENVRNALTGHVRAIEFHLHSTDKSVDDPLTKKIVQVYEGYRYQNRAPQQSDSKLGRLVQTDPENKILCYIGFFAADDSAINKELKFYGIGMVISGANNNIDLEGIFKFNLKEIDAPFEILDFDENVIPDDE